MSLNVKLVRVDNRLLHSTIVLTWSRFLNINYFLIVDDNEHVNGFYYHILKLGIPENKELKIVSSESLNSTLNKLKKVNKKYNIILVFSSYKTLLKSIKMGMSYKDIQVPYRSSRLTMAGLDKQFAASDLDLIKLCKKLGAKFYFQTTPYEEKNYGPFSKL